MLVNLIVVGVGDRRDDELAGKAARVVTPMLVPRIAAALAAVLVFNLHYKLLGREFLEGPLTSRPVLALGNWVAGNVVRSKMTLEGVPIPDRTETYSDGERSGRVDIYEPEAFQASPTQQRSAVIYFHSGAFIAGDRSFGAGVCGFLASHGAVCLSVSYRLTNSGAGVAGCIEDAWAALRWTRANAERLDIDPSKIVVAGDSAGGLLATALGTGLGADVPTGMGGFNQQDGAKTIGIDFCFDLEIYLGPKLQVNTEPLKHSKGATQCLR